MLTLALYGLLAVLLAGAIFLVATYLLPAGEQIAASIRDEPVWELPSDKRLSEADVETVRLPVALRGYRFAETDLLLDRLADELRARDREIARLRAIRTPYDVAAELEAIVSEAVDLTRHADDADYADDPDYTDDADDIAYRDDADDIDDSDDSDETDDADR